MLPAYPERIKLNNSPSKQYGYMNVLRIGMVHTEEEINGVKELTVNKFSPGCSRYTRTFILSVTVRCSLIPSKQITKTTKRIPPCKYSTKCI